MMPLWKLLLTETRQIIWQIWHRFADFIQGKEMSSNDVRTLCGRTVAQKSSQGPSEANRGHEFWQKHAFKSDE
jgi:hypothetical protein